MLSLGVALASLIIAIIALITSLISYIRHESMKQSTHQIQYVPAPVTTDVNDFEFVEKTEGLKTKFDKDFDNVL